MASSKPLGDRSAPGGRQDRSETVSGQLLERSWQLLGPSRGALGVQEVPRSFREAPREALGGHLGGLF